MQPKEIEKAILKLQKLKRNSKNVTMRIECLACFDTVISTSIVPGIIGYGKNAEEAKEWLMKKIKTYHKWLKENESSLSASQSQDYTYLSSVRM